ncbi:MAG TPA: thiolase family protein, partial [Solirubrobacteraceae bacterium]|nr:thiolase family protein [Solirubrobacteraceae bacterium]
MDVAIAGAAETPYARHPDPELDTHAALGRAAALALADAALDPREVDGLAVASFSLAPDRAVDLAWRLGLRPRWLLDDQLGGAAGVDMLAHAASAIATGEAETVLILAGDVQDPAAVAQRQAAFNVATREHLAPLSYGGPNSLFAMLTSRQMAATGLEREDYGRVVIAQREWAAGNPAATYREPLTLARYLEAPLVAEPLRRYDCVPGVAGADAIVLRAGAGAVRVLATARAFNHDDQSGDGLRTALRELAPELWRRAGAGPEDLDLACVYDDYPAIVLAQLA